MTEYLAIFNTMTMRDAKRLLTAAEEAELSRLILAEKEAKDRRANSDLYGCSCEDLEEIIREGEEAYKELVLSNVRLAMKLANEAARKNPGGINEREDYEQTALFALCQCARTFDWHYNVRFSTYAYRQIKQALIRENALNAFAVRIPEDMLYKITRMRELLEDKTEEETARELELPTDLLTDLLAASTPASSLNDPLAHDDMICELGEMIADENALSGQDIEEKIQLEWDIKWLYTTLAALPQREHDLICRRFGLCGEVPHKLQELVGVTAMTTGGVQKQITAILTRMRSSYESMPLAA